MKTKYRYSSREPGPRRTSRVGVDGATEVLTPPPPAHGGRARGLPGKREVELKPRRGPIEPGKPVGLLLPCSADPGGGRREAAKPRPKASFLGDVGAEKGTQDVA